MAKKRGNGEGSIYKDGNLWRGQVSLGRESKTGKLKRSSFTGKTRKEVQDKIAQALNDISKGTFIQPSTDTFKTWGQTWISNYKKNTLRPKTLESYNYILSKYIYPSIGDIPLKDLKTDNIQKLINSLLDTGLSSRTSRYAATLIHACLLQAVKSGLLVKNVCDAIILPKKEQKEMRVLSIDDQKKFVDICRLDRIGSAYILCLATGLRRSECLGLRWQDVNLEHNYINITQALVRVKSVTEEKTTSELMFQQPKTASGIRTIPIPESIKKLLELHKLQQDKEKSVSDDIYSDKDLVFCTEIGKPIEPRNFERKFKQLQAKANISPINLHGLRHSFATRLLEENEHPKIVQELLGHKSIQITLDTYSHVSKELKRNAAIKLDKFFSNSIGDETQKTTPTCLTTEEH